MLICLSKFIVCHLVGNVKQPFSAISAEAGTSDSRHSWMPDQVLHDYPEILYGFILF